MFPIPSGCQPSPYPGYPRRRAEPAACVTTDEIHGVSSEEQPDHSNAGQTKGTIGHPQGAIGAIVPIVWATSATINASRARFVGAQGVLCSEPLPQAAAG